VPPKAAEPSTKTKQNIILQGIAKCIAFCNEFVFLEVAKMVFSDIEFPEPNQEEVKLVKWIAKNNPEDLDSRELWVLEQSLEGDEDE
jgi:hypothetical protein